MGIAFLKSEGKYCDLYQVKAKVGSTRFKLLTFTWTK